MCKDNNALGAPRRKNLNERYKLIQYMSTLIFSQFCAITEIQTKFALSPVGENECIKFRLRLEITLL